MKRLLLVLIAIVFLGPAYHEADGGKDTGTYEILDYSVKLEPQEDGTIEITYYQRWNVTAGHIPWVTVGTANPDFSIVKDSATGNISRIQSANQRGWSGVRIALDNDYKQGETFEIGFSISQKSLLFLTRDYYRLEFIPGWYDRARIRKMSVGMEFFAELEGIKVDPEPDRAEVREIVWERSELSPGEKISISISFPKDLFPKALQVPSARSKTDKRSSNEGFNWFGIIVVLLVVIPVGRSIWKSRKYAGGGLIGHGGTGAGGCACACAGCACACACAGGGAAGCDRKLTLSCPLCVTCEKEGCPLRSHTVEATQPM